MNVIKMQGEAGRPAIPDINNCRKSYTHKHTGGNMANQPKSGYEIRADLLSLAESVIINNIENERQTIYSWNENHSETKKEIPLRTYTAQDVIQTAKEFNDFVNEK